MQHLLLVLSFCLRLVSPSDVREDPVQLMRAALGPPSAEAWLVLAGRARRFGREDEFRWVVAPDGRFARTIGGELGGSLVYDGHEVWEREGRGPGHALELLARQLALVEAWSWRGFLVDSAEAFELAATETSDRLSLSKGALRGSIALDPASHLPVEFAYESAGNPCSMSLAGWSSLGEGPSPHALHVRTPTGIEQVYQVETARWTSPGESSVFAHPATRPSDTRFDAERPLAIPLTRAPTGHLFLELELDDRDAGWFVFDTGAAVSVIDPLVAQRFGMEPVGTTALAGAGERIRSARLVRGRELRLGRLLIDGLVWTESDLPSSLSSLLGRELSGVLGWDVLARAVVELDLARDELRVHDPERFQGTGLAFEPLVLHRRHPFLRARFAGEHEGLFCFDSGAGATTVIFHRPTVEALQLAQGQELVFLAAAGAGGVIDLRLGRVSSFEIAGRVHRDAPALFAFDAKGALTDEWSAGTIGQQFLRDSVLVFDYAGKRYAVRASGEEHEH